MKKNNRGFSLVELMIVVGMLGGLSLVVMNINKQSTKSSAKLQFDSDVTLTTNEINGILSDPAKCLATLGSTASPTNINGKYYTTASGSAPANGYGNSGLKITSYTLSGTAPDGVLNIAYQNKNILKGSTGSPTVSKKINMYIEGAPGAVTKCRSLSTSTTDIWSHGTGSNIYYSVGNVGIGTTAPLAKLHVNANTNQNFWVVSNSNGNDIASIGIASVNDANTVYQPMTFLANRFNFTNGNVGIGITNPGAKLEVAGGIKPGPATTGASCAPNAEGAFAYDMAAHAPVYCSNTGLWAAMGGSGGFGGSFLINTFGGSCSAVNPKTGGCSCPAGMSGNLSGQAWRWSQWDTTIVICY